MVTLRERKTHYGIIVNLPDDHTAEKVNHAVTSAFASIPAHLQIRGVEMAGQGDLAAANGIKIFFAERCSPWQRGANENFNGLVRQHFPKGTDLSVHPTQHVNAVTRELNTRHARPSATAPQQPDSARKPAKPAPTASLSR